MKIGLSVILALALHFPGLPAGPATQQPFRIVVSTRHPEVKSGRGAEITVRLTNTSQEMIDTSANVDSRTGLDPNFDIDIRNSSGHSAPKRTYKHPEFRTGQAFIGRALKPGETLTEHFDLSRAYELTEPGNYVVQVSRTAPERLGGGVVKSNKITVTVAP